MNKVAVKAGRNKSSVIRKYSLLVRFSDEEVRILDLVSKDCGLDKANTIRVLLLKEYKRIVKS